jgi:hypothetical protein
VKDVIVAPATFAAAFNMDAIAIRSMFDRSGEGKKNRSRPGPTFANHLMSVAPRSA